MYGTQSTIIVSGSRFDTNAAQYGSIVTADSVSDVICIWVKTDGGFGRATEGLCMAALAARSA